MSRTETVRDTAIELARTLKVPVPEGESSEEFRLSIAQTLRIRELQESIIGLIRDGHLWPRSADGGYTTGTENATESTQVLPDDAKKALAKHSGWEFIDTPVKSLAGTTKARSLSEPRINAIVEMAVQLKYDPLAIPTGGKKTIERECLDRLAGDPYRFTPGTFKKTWQSARNAGRIDVVGADIYRDK
jgi:hypothetical protein